jgi:hypothetical protein
MNFVFDGAEKMTKKRDLWRVRGFDVLQPFFYTGQMANKPGFRELEVEDRNLYAAFHTFPHMYSGSFEWLTAKITFSTDDLAEAKVEAETASKVITLWAEKRRLKGNRGFRLNAVTNGRLDKTRNGLYQLTKYVVLGSKAFRKNGQSDTWLIGGEQGRLAHELEELRGGLDVTGVAYDAVTLATMGTGLKIAA